jgi:hypothetical protein
MQHLRPDLKNRSSKVSANSLSTGVKTAGYISYVGHCLYHAGNIASMLASEAPAGLFAD